MEIITKNEVRLLYEAAKLKSQRDELAVALKYFVDAYAGSKRAQLGNGNAAKFYDLAVNALAKIKEGE